MSFINKVKNFFYEDIEEDDEEFEAREQAKREARFKKEEEKRKREQEKELMKEIQNQKKMPKPSNDDLSERELFKSERTFNFPDLGDDIFDIGDEPVVEEPPKEETRSAVKEDRNLYASRTRSNPVPSIRTTYQEKPKEKEETVDKTKFHPSPVVSPVYGILDKNYTVDDVVDKNLDKTKEFSIEKKSVDFDTVRNKAYKELDEEIEATLTKTKDIFYNLDEEVKEETPEVEDYVEEAYDKNENDEDEVIITYEGEKEVKDSSEPEEIEQEDEEDFTPDVSITPTKEEVKPKRTRRSKTVVENEEEKDEEKEDLFNLIDNMYNDEEDEEEED